MIDFYGAVISIDSITHKANEEKKPKQTTIKTKKGVKFIQLSLIEIYNEEGNQIRFVLGCFPKVRTGRPDHGRTGHFDNKIGFYQEFLLKKKPFPLRILFRI